VFFDSAVTELKLGNRDVDYDDRAAVAKVCEEFTTLYARTDETHDAALFDAIPEERRKVARGIEVGQIFFFGTKYSEPMGAVVVNDKGERVPVQMGSHGIGVSRLLGAIIEASHDAGGIIWPDSVAPFGAAVLNLRAGDAACDAACETAYAALLAAGKDPLYDDRDERPGAKFAATDLVGIPWQLVIGPKGLADGVVELKRRATGERQTLPLEAALKAITG
jgi:prolyl-tRNA synthetase